MASTDGGVCVFEVQLSPTPTAYQYKLNVSVRLIGQSDYHLPSSTLVLPIEELRALRLSQDDNAYRSTLTKSFFADHELDKAFGSARDVADLTNCKLRIRILIDPEAKDLHAVNWELLGDFGRGKEPSPVATNLRRLLSRYLTPPARTLRPSSGKLRSIILIANPRNRNGTRCAIPDIDVAVQLEAVSGQMADNTDLCPLTGSNACKERLLQELQAGADILYIVCHGKLTDSGPVLLLEGADQEIEEVDGKQLVEIIAGLDVLPPQLVVIGSCQSAGGDGRSENLDQGFLSSIGALMIAAGVPAVIGMQGKILQQTNAKFFEVFFRELFAEGQVERATSAARQAVRDRSDWWMPALLLSKDDGQLWPSQNARQEFPDWDVLLAAVQSGDCTPILGSDVVKAFSNREFAKVLLSEMREQIGISSSDELSWVAQQFKIQKNRDVTERFDAFIKARIAKDKIWPQAKEKLLDAVARWGSNPGASSQLQVLNALASLPFRYYVTTNPDDLMEQALQGQNRTFVKQVCPWQGVMQEVQSLDLGSVAEATAECPLVYHLFGSLEGQNQERSTVVLTEDDFFKHLLWIASYRDLVPIKTPLCSSSLLFLGFHLQDWEFRILLRCIETLPGSDLLRGKLHAAVQIPLDGDSEKQRRTQELLQEFFTKTNIRLSIYYGTAEEFVRELQRRWAKRYSGG